MWWNQAKWVGTCKLWFWDEAKQKEKFPLFSIVLQNLQMLVSPELINQFSSGFQLNEIFKIPDTTMKKKIYYLHDFRLNLLDCI